MLRADAQEPEDLVLQTCMLCACQPYRSGPAGSRKCRDLLLCQATLDVTSQLCLSLPVCP